MDINLWFWLIVFVGCFIFFPKFRAWLRDMREEVVDTAIVAKKAWAPEHPLEHLAYSIYVTEHPHDDNTRKSWRELYLEEREAYFAKARLTMYPPKADGEPGGQGTLCGKDISL
jgi:hypothetical protein